MMMYFGIEIAISFSPLSTGAGVGPNDAANIGSFAASPLTKLIHSASDLKTFSLSPISHEIVEGWLAGLAITILFFHFGCVRSWERFDTSAGFKRSLL